MDSRKVCFKGQLILCGGTPLALFLYGAHSQPPSPTLCKRSGDNAQTFSTLRSHSMGAFVAVADFANSERPFNPPPQSTNALFRAACLPQMVVSSSSASNPKPSCIFLGLPLLSRPPCLLGALPPMRNGFSCILERPPQPFLVESTKVAATLSRRTTTPFKLVFYCRVPFSVNVSTPLSSSIMRLVLSFSPSVASIVT